MGWKPWQKALAVVGILLVFAMTGAVGYAAMKLSLLETTVLDASKLNISEEVEQSTETGYLNVALFGLDSRDGTLGEGNLSDSIIIASLNLETKEVRLCSVFRDTLLDQDGTINKANAAYSLGNAQAAVAMLNRNLDLDIKHYVSVNFNVLSDIIDELGGVEIDLTEEEVYWTNGYATETSKVTGKTKYELTSPGLQVLDGVQATSYCRIRYTTGDDFKRAERQRTVLEQIVKKAQTADLSTLNRIIDKVFPNVATNFTLKEVLKYAKYALDYKLTDMSGFPFTLFTETLSYVGSSVIVDNLQENVSQLHAFLFDKVGYTPSSTVVMISNEIDNFVASGYNISSYDYNQENTFQWNESEEIGDNTGNNGDYGNSGNGGSVGESTPPVIEDIPGDTTTPDITTPDTTTPDNGSNDDVQETEPTVRDEGERSTAGKQEE
jgi:LCP family protein required for cell wall assembly